MVHLLPQQMGRPAVVEAELEILLRVVQLLKDTEVHQPSKVKVVEAAAWLMLADLHLLALAVEMPLEVTELQMHTTIILTTMVAAEAAVEESTAVQAVAQVVKVEAAEDHGNKQVVQV